MAVKKQEAPVAETPAVKPETAAAPPQFTLDRLRKDCLRLFGITVSTFDGATLGLTGRYSVEEMRSRIERWKNTRVLPAKKEEK